MHATEWIRRERDALDAFQTWWLSNHAKDPAQFPLEMSQADWEEQFRLWQVGTEP